MAGRGRDRPDRLRKRFVSPVRRPYAASLNRNRRQALMDMPRLQIVRSNAAQAEDGTAPCNDARSNNRARSKPDLVFQRDWLDHEIKANQTPVVASRAEIRALRQAAVIADPNL